MSPSSASTLNQRNIGENQRIRHSQHGKSSFSQPERDRLLLGAVACVALNANGHGIGPTQGALLVSSTVFGTLPPPCLF